MKKFYAYSLLELMITLSLLAILLFIAVPAWNNFIIHNNAQTGTDRIVTALQFTRLEAIKRKINVSFCRVEDKDAIGDWSQGQKVIDANQQQIRVFSALKGHDKLLWNGSLGKNSCITFTPLGITAGQNGSFQYCPQGKPANALAVIIQTIGVVRIDTVLPDGKPIGC